MNERASPRGRTILRVSAALAARFIHDAGAEGAAVRVTNPRALRVLERAFLRALTGKGEPQVMQVSQDVAGAFQRSGERQPEAEAFYLAVGLDCQGRGAFLLRPVPARRGDVPAPARCPVEARMLVDLQAYLRSVVAPPSVLE